MRDVEVLSLLDAAARAYGREAADLEQLANADEAQSEAAGEADRFGQHPADAASDTAEREIDLGLHEEAAVVLAEIDAARLRLEQGTYGVCEVCGRQIPDARLEAVPWTRRCIDDEWAAERERGLPAADEPLPWSELQGLDDAESGLGAAARGDAGDSDAAVWDPEDDHGDPPVEEAAVPADAGELEAAGAEPAPPATDADRAATGRRFGT